MSAAMRLLELGEESTVVEKTERGVVDKPRVGVAEQQGESVVEALFGLDLAGVVVGLCRCCCGRWRRSGNAGKA